MNILRRLMKPALLLMAVAALVLLPARQSQAATNMIAEAKSNKVSTGKLVKNAKGVRYRYKNGKYAKNQWHSINGKIYYFGSNGYAKTGWFTYQKKTYYANKSGVVYHNKWVTKNKKKYFLKSNGVRAEKEWVKKNGKYYYLKKNGVMATKTQVSSGGNYYYVAADGVRKTNCWVVQKGKRYYFGKDGTRYENKWVKYKGKYYYLGSNGAMATSCWVGDYYVGSDGARKTNCTVDGYKLDSTGKRIKVTKFSGSYLIVGDSRVVGMDSAVSDAKTKFIGKVSMGYTWLKSTAGPQVESYLAGNPKLTVVFAFGVNDLGNASKYISYYKSLKKEYPQATFYFLSVNPVDEQVAAANGYTVKNSQIKAFNKQIKSAFSGKYINSYSYLNKNGFSTADGIHYTSATYQKLYQFILSKIS